MRTMLRRAAYRVFANDAAFSRFIGWRRSVLKQTLVGRLGDQVLHGPLAGLRLDPAHSELPKFLGTYEHVLHGWLAGALARDYQTVLNIGCAEGYYAVGLARLLPRARVLAFDIDPRQQAICRANAERNGLGGRVAVSGRFEGAMFADHAGERCLVLCDIEGGEIDLLRPDLWPALAHMDLLVELHEEHMQNLAEEFIRRFAASHEFIHILRQYPTDLAFLDQILPAEQDQLAACYENRTGPTSWMGLTARSLATGQA